jgi:hypothetical protein
METDKRWFIPLRQSVKICGSLEPYRVLPYFEEQLTLDEYEEIETFLKWLIENSRSFGWNLPEVYAEFLMAKNGRLPGQVRDEFEFVGKSEVLLGTFISGEDKVILLEMYKKYNKPKSKGIDPTKLEKGKQ